MTHFKYGLVFSLKKKVLFSLQSKVLDVHMYEANSTRQNNKTCSLSLRLSFSLSCGA